MKHLMLSVLLGLFASNVYATQARLIALGMDELDDEGSYYIKDSRNIFLNSAYINDFADRLIVEWGSTGTAAGNGATVDQDNTPKAQGGFLKQTGNFVWGVYYGNESNTSSFLRVAGTSNAASLAAGSGSTTTKVIPTADNQIDLFIGADHGLQWGVNVVYLNNEDEQNGNAKDEGSAVRLGVKDGDTWDFHVNLSTSNDAEVTSNIDMTAVNAGFGALSENGVTNKFEGKFGIHVGGSYNFGDWGRPYAFFKTFSWDQTDNYSKYGSWSAIPAISGRIGKQGKSDGKFDTYVIGWGKTHKISDTDTLFFGLHARKIEVELNLARKVEVNNTTVPLALGYEAQATSWLTLRGNITHNLYGKKDNKNFDYAAAVAKNLVSGVYGAEGKGTIQNSTVVTAGASLNFGDLVLDGTIGTSSSSSKTDGTLDLDQLMSTVAMTYAF